MSEEMTREETKVKTFDILRFIADNAGLSMFEAIEKAYNMGLSEQEPKMGHWIPVSERLPEDEQNVLFSTTTERVHCGKYYDDGSANQWYSDRDKQRAWNNVVNAWMPLPKPYGESEG